MLKIGLFKGGTMSHPVPGMDYYCEYCKKLIEEPIHSCDI